MEIIELIIVSKELKEAEELMDDYTVKPTLKQRTHSKDSDLK